MPKVAKPCCENPFVRVTDASADIEPPPGRGADIL